MIVEFGYDGTNNGTTSELWREMKKLNPSTWKDTVGFETVVCIHGSKSLFYNNVMAMSNADKQKKGYIKSNSY